ncbi:MAG: TonB-dependent receptor, partial [Chitinophagaceae bacterium]
MKTLHRFLLAAGLLVLAFTSRAQISGTLTSQQQPLESISVSLLRAKDSSLVKIALTDKAGQFQFTNLAAGSYRVSVNSLGFQPYLSQVYPFSGSALSLGSIELPLQAKSLGEVTVSSKKPLVELKADKMVVNVDASPTNAGNTALEVLEKSPGVSVDKDGNISLKGKQGVTVLVDGRPSYLSGTDLANLLKGMSASQLDQIEIMTNPPARFDASGNSGVINIKTKKNRTVGFNGSLNLGYGQGVYPKTNGGLNLNYRKNRINLFGSYNYSYRGSYQQFNVIRNVFNQNQALAFTLDQNGYMPDTRSAHSAKAGIDITFSRSEE